MNKLLVSFSLQLGGRETVRETLLSFFEVDDVPNSVKVL